MRRLVLLFLASLFISTSYAQSIEVKRTIKKYDVYNLIHGKTFPIPSSFWFTVRDNHKEIVNIGKAYDKDNKSLKQALIFLNENLDDYSAFTNLSTIYDSLSFRLSKDLGLENITKKPIKLLLSNEINASMDPTGQMTINRGVLNTMTYEEILAVCAHEIAHYICSHSLVKVWKTIKKKNRNRNWANIGASLAIAAMAATSAYATSNGVETTGINDMIGKSDVIFQNAIFYADGATLRYRYRYNREEEVEADIIAFRFMEKMGYGGQHVISMLRKMRNRYGDSAPSKYSTHPTLSFRIDVLSALKKEE